MSTNLICRLPGLVLSVPGLIANIAVIISIKKSKITRPPSIFIIGCICLANVAFCCFFPISSAFGASFTSVRQYVSVPLTMIQLGLHTLLTYDRWLAVARPQQYRQPRHKKIFKRLILVTVIVGIIFGIAIRASRTVSFEVTPYITISLRFLVTIIISIVYIKVYKTIKTNNARIADRSSENSNDSAVAQLRKKNEQYLLLLSLWITVSFLVFNIPMGVFTAFVKINAPCSTTDGKVFGAVFFTFVINLLCDPITFFIMERRRKRACVVQVRETAPREGPTAQRATNPTN